MKGDESNVVVLEEPLLVMPPPSQEAMIKEERISFDETQQPNADVAILTTDYENNNELMNEMDEWDKGEKQPSQCRDGFWALLFVSHLLTMIVLAILWGIPSLKSILSDDNPSSFLQDGTTAAGNNNNQITTVALYMLCTTLASMGIASLALVFMTHFARVVIQISVIVNFIFTVLVIVDLAMISPIMLVPSAIILILGFLYIWRIWSYIPYCAANLETAMTAVRTNIGVVVPCFFLTVSMLGYVCIWLLCFAGVYTKIHFRPNGQGGEWCVDRHSDNNNNDDDGLEEKDDQVFYCNRELDPVVYALFLLCFYWTQQVIRNANHVIVSGVVGTWWFAPLDASGMCSPAIWDSTVRATTSSFGSICLGSLLVGLVQLLNSMARSARVQRGNLLFCLLQCILVYLQALLEYFNKWAFCYVGLYGYSYLEAGPKVMKLFADRGWTTIINDHLIHRVLLWLSLVIGLLCGAASCTIYSLSFSSSSFDTDDDNDNDNDSKLLTLFFVFGLAMGGAIAGLLMSLVSSAVDTVVVCFAEAPLEFRVNHDRLSQTMENAWFQTYPYIYRAVPENRQV